jgi:hypothetical protein
MLIFLSFPCSCVGTQPHHTLYIQTNHVPTQERGNDKKTALTLIQSALAAIKNDADDSIYAHEGDEANAYRKIVLYPVPGISKLTTFHAGAWER